jgi:hypothetical protein
MGGLYKDFLDLSTGKGARSPPFFRTTFVVVRAERVGSMEDIAVLKSFLFHLFGEFLLFFGKTFRMFD